MWMWRKKSIRKVKQEQQKTLKTKIKGYIQKLWTNKASLTEVKWVYTG